MGPWEPCTLPVSCAPSALVPCVPRSRSSASRNLRFKVLEIGLGGLRRRRLGARLPVGQPLGQAGEASAPDCSTAMRTSSARSTESEPCTGGQVVRAEIAADGAGGSLEAARIIGPGPWTQRPGGACRLRSATWTPATARRAAARCRPARRRGCCWWRCARRSRTWTSDDPAYLDFDYVRRLGHVDRHGRAARRSRCVRCTWARAGSRWPGTGRDAARLAAAGRRDPMPRWSRWSAGGCHWTSPPAGTAAAPPRAGSGSGSATPVRCSSGLRPRRST